MAKKRKDPNEEIGPKYNIKAWEHFGRTKKLKGGFGFDGEKVEGTMKIKRRKGKNIVKFKQKGIGNNWELLSNKTDTSGI